MIKKMVAVGILVGMVGGCSATKLEGDFSLEWTRRIVKCVDKGDVAGRLVLGPVFGAALIGIPAFCVGFLLDKTVALKTFDKKPKGYECRIILTSVGAVMGAPAGLFAALMSYDSPSSGWGSEYSSVLEYVRIFERVNNSVHLPVVSVDIDAKTFKKFVESYQGNIVEALDGAIKELDEAMKGLVPYATFEGKRWPYNKLKENSILFIEAIKKVRTELVAKQEIAALISHPDRP